MSPAENRREVARQLLHKAWTDEEFRQALMSNPKAVIEKEFGERVPDDVTINVVQDDHKNMTFVIPPNPNAMVIDEADAGPGALLICSAKSCCGETSCWACG